MESGRDAEKDRERKKDSKALGENTNEEGVPLGLFSLTNASHLNLS